MTKITNILAKIAPTVATVIGGPVAGYVTQLVTTKLGLNDGASLDEINQSLHGADPATIAEIKKIEADYKKELLKHNIKIEELNTSDRDSARNREINIGGYTTPTLATIILLGFFAVVYHLLFGVGPANDIALVIIGSVGTLATQVVNYYFGSSSGSKQKSEMLGKK